MGFLPTTRRRIAIAAAGVAVLVGGLVPAVPASAASLNTGNVNLRACVDLANPVCANRVGTTNGANIKKLRCWRDGSYATGTYGSVRWFLVMLTDEREGYVHASFVKDQYGVPNCSTLSYVRAADFAISQFDQAAAPTAIANAYADSDWAPGPKGEWSGDCAKFTGSSYRTAGVSYPAADAIGQYNLLRSKVLQGIPRYGSPVFYGTNPNNRWGHTAIYIGGTSIMSTQGFDKQGLKVTVQDIGTYANYLGYALL